MTAGSGIIHQEMPQGDEHGKMAGFQLWANLPASQKMMDPSYRDVTAAQIPVARLENGVTLKIICGRVGDVQGPVRDIVIDPQYLDISVPAQTSYTHPTKPGHTVLAYVIGGQGYFCREKKPFTYEVEGINYFDIQKDPAIGNETLVLFEDGNHVFVNTEDDPIRFLLISGKPLHEPIAWRGPIVMNTQGELRQAFQELQEGTFVKTGANDRHEAS
jgi:redox-sensitive bicupin YhaK (pirin superfamily)